MARNSEAVLRDLIGGLVIETAVQRAENESLKERVTALESALKEPPK